MPTSDIESELEVRATEVQVSSDELAVELEDGRSLTVPLVHCHSSK
jgi:hypothetical protein